MQTYFYLGVGSGVGPASIRSSSMTGTTGSNHRATNDNMPPPSVAIGDPTTTADGDDASLVVKSTLERTSPRRISPLLAAAHQTTVPSFNPGLILMCQQAVAASEAAMRTATEAANSDGINGPIGIIRAALCNHAAATSLSRAAAGAAQLPRFALEAGSSRGDKDMLLASSSSLPLPPAAACQLISTLTIPRPASCRAWM